MTLSSESTVAPTTAAAGETMLIQGDSSIQAAVALQGAEEESMNMDASIPASPADAKVIGNTQALVRRRRG